MLGWPQQFVPYNLIQSIRFANFFFLKGQRVIPRIRDSETENKRSRGGGSLGVLSGSPTGNFRDSKNLR